MHRGGADRSTACCPRMPMKSRAESSCACARRNDRAGVPCWLRRKSAFSREGSDFGTSFGSDPADLSDEARNGSGPFAHHSASVSTHGRGKRLKARRNGRALVWCVTEMERVTPSLPNKIRILAPRLSAHGSTRCYFRNWSQFASCLLRSESLKLDRMRDEHPHGY